MTNVSMIGLGDMGSAIARTLVEKGHRVTVWNRSPERSRPLAEIGATVAASAEAAIAASPVTVICVKSHDQTIALLRGAAGSLRGKTVIELSTGGAAEAEALAALLAENGAEWMIGIIQGYPTAIGTDSLVLTMAGKQENWAQWGPLIKGLGGGAAHVGEEPGMLAALFAALFTTRQGFMFGMIYGGLVCKRAGIPLQTFIDQIPVSMGVLPSYYKYFAETVGAGAFDDPPATMRTYAAALDDVLSTFKETGAPAELPQLFSDMAHRGMDAGLEDKALTALVELLGTKPET